MEVVVEDSGNTRAGRNFLSSKWTLDVLSIVAANLLPVPESSIMPSCLSALVGVHPKLKRRQLIATKPINETLNQIP